MTADDIEHAADTAALRGLLSRARDLRFAARLLRAAEFQDSDRLSASLTARAAEIYARASSPIGEAPARSSLRVGARNSGAQSLEPAGRRDWYLAPRGPVAVEARTHSSPAHTAPLASPAPQLAGGFVPPASFPIGDSHDA